jgi:hypothetical protein
MFGVTPAHGFFIRHAKGLRLDDVKVRTINPDLRHAVHVEHASDVVLDGVDVRPADGVPAVVLKNVRDLRLRGCHGLADRTITGAADESF